MGINFDEEIRDLLILCSFPERWNELIMAVSNCISRSNTLKFDDVIGVIMSEETHRKTSRGCTLESVLNTKRRGRMNVRENNSRNHGKSRGKSNRKRSQSRGPRDCWYYGKIGHEKKYFWT